VVLVWVCTCATVETAKARHKVTDASIKLFLITLPEFIVIPPL
jgi:hypothetical protein